MTKRSDEQTRQALEWFQDARFGLFIHWGIYAVAAGRWGGKSWPGPGEHIMNRAKIPVAEYETLAPRFNPTRFDPDGIVRLARDAGMKYIVITAKHHDGFAMYDSAADDFNIVKATPCVRDILGELADACRRADMPLGFYYSHARDWRHPDSVSNFGNTWDYPDESAKNPDRYMRDKVLPQLEELLTNYGPVALMWFDTPFLLERRHADRIRRLVKRLQPRCLINNRIGHDLGDYESMGDNQVPPAGVGRPCETPATMNDTWAFRTDDRNWKSADTLLHLLIDLSSKGINYLLNIGPRADGTVPDASAQRLRAIGAWLETNGEAIHGAAPGPLPGEFEWGRITTRPGRVYLHFMRWPRGRFVLHGLRNRAIKAYPLARPNESIPMSQTRDEALDHDMLELRLPAKRPERPVAVVALDIDGEARFDPLPLQQPDGAVALPVSSARLHPATQGKPFTIERGFCTRDWTNVRNRLSWNFRVVDPGEFDVVVYTTARHGQPWRQAGHRVRARIEGRTVEAKTARRLPLDSPRAQYFPEWGTRLGRVRIDEAGEHELVLDATQIDRDNPDGLMVSSVRLERHAGKHRQ